jgi:hypothetical protein
MTSSAITPTGLNSTFTPRGDATTGRVSDAAASKTTVVSALVRATSPGSRVSSRVRWASRLRVGQVDLVTL